MTLRYVVFAFLAAVVGCAGPATSSSSAPSPTPEPTLFVRTFPGDGCPLVALPPRPLTFRIDPAAAQPDQVVAVDASGEPHQVFWAEGFVGATLDDPVVRDPDGEVVARDGEVFAAPDEGPRLHGYDVCAGSGLIYVLLQGRA